MSEPQNAPDMVPVRRRDRAEDGVWIEAFLARVPTGILALAGNAGEAPYVNSNIFVYDASDRSLIFHTARLGALRDRVDAGEPAHATFHAFTMGRLLPDTRALEFSVEYESVTATGTIDVVSAPDEAERALQQIMDKYAPHLVPDRDYEPATAADLKRTSVYRLRIGSWSGKRKQAPADAAGAYLYTPRY